MDAKAVGLRIKAARKAKGLTQEQLAERVDLSPEHVSVIERGVKAPNLVSFVAIANALGVSADQLLADVVEKSAAYTANELWARVGRLPQRERLRVLEVLRVLTER